MLASLPKDCLEILLVDDDEREIQSVCAALSRPGQSVHLRVLRTGDEALAYLHPSDQRLRHRRPQLILIEADHVPCHGFDLLENVKSDHDLASIPVVLLTGEDHGPLPAYYEGRCTVVSKPLNAERLQGLLHDCLDG